MAGTGRIYVTAVRGVGDVNLTHQYDVDIRFDIAFDWGGYNYGGAPYSISCDGQNASGSATFAVGSGGGQWIWTNIGGTKTFRITMPTSGQPKSIGFSATINTGISPATITANGSYALSAITWEHTVSYNANGGTGAPDSQKKIYGSILTLSSVRPTRDGYVFLGWATTSAGDVAYTPGSTYGADADITLYAVWKIAYIQPIITNLKALRCDSRGTPTGNGTYIKVSGRWQVDRTLNDSNIATSIKIEYKKTSTGSLVKASETKPNAASGEISSVIGNGQISASYVYFVIVTITDLNGSKQEEVIVPAQFRAMDVANKGRSVAFGGTASDSEPGCDFYQDVRLHGRLLLGDQELMGIKEYDSGQVRGPYANVNSSNHMHVWLYKVGKIVHCKIEMLAQFPSSGSFNDFGEVVIPAEFRSKYHVFCACPEVVAGTIIGTGRYRIGDKISLDVENASYAERTICTSWIAAS